MKRNIFCVLFAGLILLTGFAIVKNKPLLFHSFYKNPTYDAFVESVGEYLNDCACKPKHSWFSGNPPASDVDLARIVQRMIFKRMKEMTFFEAQVFRHHPEFIAPYRARYPKLNPYEKGAFLRAMRMLGIELDQELTIDSEELYEWVADPQLVHLSLVESCYLEKDEDDVALLQCFCATGNEKYVIKVIEHRVKKPLNRAQGNYFGPQNPLKQYIIADRDLNERVWQLICDDPVYETLRQELFH